MQYDETDLVTLFEIMAAVGSMIKIAKQNVIALS